MCLRSMPEKRLRDIGCIKAKEKKIEHLKEIATRGSKDARYVGWL